MAPSVPGCRPTVPGLTLHGWTQWMTLAMRAHPDEEARRFAKVITMLPINAESPLDGKLERLPKQISRHLLPEKADPASRGKFSAALRVVQEALGLLSPPPKPSLQERRPSQSRAVSPRSRYKPSSVGIPSPPSSVSGAAVDDDYRRGDRERERNYRDLPGRPYESNGSARRDPPLSRSTTGLGLPTRPPSRTGPPSTTSSRRRSSPAPYHRSSVSGASGREERGYTRSSSDATIYPHRSDQRERERDRERERERDRERERERERERDRDRERDARDSKARGREREADRRDRGSRRSASVVSNTDRKGGLGRPNRRSSVIVQDERAGNLGRAPTWGDFFTGKSAMA